MEKNYDGLLRLGISYQHLLLDVRDEVRRAARAIPKFRDSKNGCIRITIVPLTALADAWLGGGLSSFGKHPETETHDVCEREFIYKIHPEGSHTIQYECDDGHIEPVNCYGYSALKTAWASKVRQWQNVERSIEPGPASGYYVEENGWSMHEGSVYATVKLDDMDFVRLYVCTSGADSKDDEKCSFAGMLAAQKFFENATSSARLGCARGEAEPIHLDFKLIPDFVSMQEM